MLAFAFKFYFQYIWTQLTGKPGATFERAFWSRNNIILHLLNLYLYMFSAFEELRKYIRAGTIVCVDHGHKHKRTVILKRGRGLPDIQCTKILMYLYSQYKSINSINAVNIE